MERMIYDNAFHISVKFTRFKTSTQNAFKIKDE